ncbi:MAG: hypothetical protein UHK44_07155 [Bacteroidaceae bacterium]|nr:hypothetical protein [Bacteroidaceae bacterium]
MKKAAYILLTLMLVLSCSEGGRDLSQFSSDGARSAAEYFYELLANGQSQAYVDNMQESASMDTAKYSQFVDLMEQFLHEEKELRGGILSARAERDTMVDTISMVYLNVHFGDSTREEIMLPVVYTRGRWWIR